MTAPAPDQSPGRTLSEAAVVTGYYRAIVARNYREAADYLAPNATGADGQKLTLKSFLRLAHTLDGIGGPVTRFSAEILRTMVVMTNDRARYGPYHTHLRMVQTRHGWAIASIDRILSAARAMLIVAEHGGIFLSLTVLLPAQMLCQRLRHIL